MIDCLGTGIQNEKNIRNALNRKEYYELNTNLQKLISDSFLNYEGIIICTEQAGTNKSDMMITIGDESHTYSIKCGQSNSLHQEKIEDFIEFFELNCSISDQQKNDLRLFIWGDGTFTGTGLVNDRLNVYEFKEQHSNSFENIYNFFKTVKEPLIRRLLITGGALSSSPAEFVYYGNTTNGICCNTENILDWMLDKEKRAITVGNFTFQAWNRNINGGNKSENKRGEVQFKWASIEKDLKDICGE
jgi:hypothetical protein